MKPFQDFLTVLGETLLSVLPVAAFMIFFYLVILRERLAHPRQLVIGFVMILAGLTLFLLGLEKALFPAGRMMVEQLGTAGQADGAAAPGGELGPYRLILGFAFAIAFGAAVAEPALLAISLRVNELTGGAVNALGLRITAALGVAIGVTIGCLRIITGFPLHWCLGVAYLIIILQTLFAPRVIVPLAYDSGGVSTTAVTVPVITALGLGLAEQVPGRSQLLDGFGLIALACTYPVIAVLAYAQIATALERRQARRRRKRRSAS